MYLPRDASVEKFHEHFVILDAVYDDLTGQPSTFNEAEPAIEGLSGDIRRANLNGELPVTGLTPEQLSRVPQS